MSDPFDITSLELPDARKSEREAFIQIAVRPAGPCIDCRTAIWVAVMLLLAAAAGAVVASAIMCMASNCDDGNPCNGVERCSLFGCAGVYPIVDESHIADYDCSGGKLSSTNGSSPLRADMDLNRSRPGTFVVNKSAVGPRVRAKVNGKYQKQVDGKYQKKVNGKYQK